MPKLSWATTSIAWPQTTSWLPSLESCCASSHSSACATHTATSSADQPHSSVVAVIILAPSSPLGLLFSPSLPPEATATENIVQQQGFIIRLLVQAGSRSRSQAAWALSIVARQPMIVGLGSEDGPRLLVCPEGMRACCGTIRRRAQNIVCGGFYPLAGSLFLGRGGWRPFHILVVFVAGAFHKRHCARLVKDGFRSRI